MLLIQNLAQIVSTASSANNSKAEEIGKAVNDVLVYSLIPSVLAFSFFVFIFYRQRREMQVRKDEFNLRQQLSEVEMKTLRAQMNPHFIYNALNSIYTFIQERNDGDASEYLLRFSRLMRLVLEHSMKTEISLTEELEALELYMQIEKLRVRSGFRYEIIIADNLDPEEILFPPLILQPFIENCIWHGFGAKKTEGIISIEFQQTDEMLRVSIKDNGDPESGKPIFPGAAKNKSHGTDIIRERLSILNNKTGSNSRFTREKILDDAGNPEGMQVILFLPLITEDSSMLSASDSRNN